MSSVKVTADKNGNIIGVSQNNPEYGYIRIEQQTIQIDEQGWLKSVKRSTLLKGKMTDLLEAKYKDGSTLPGKIIIKESFTPFNPENPDRDLKIAGKTGVICRYDDQPIYRQSFYTGNLDAYDELIPHNNNEEIKEVMQAQNALHSLGEVSAEANLG